MTGYEDLIDEAARLTSSQRELDDDAKQEIGRRLNVLLNANDAPTARITYFVSDNRKADGAYRTSVGAIVGYGELSRQLKMDNGDVIDLDNVSEILADCFDGN